MPLTEFQSGVLALLAQNRTPDSHLAGGAALHISPRSKRYTNDLDFFHDSADRVASAFAEDTVSLKGAGYDVSVEISQPGFIRSVVTRDGESTLIDWAHDSAWRFVPPVRNELGGFVLNDVDLAVNKALAVAGRDEPRDFVDILYIHERVLPLGAVVWAAAGKDPGFSPLSLLELLKRRGRYQQRDFDRLDLSEPIDLERTKTTWLQALEEAEAFIRSRPPEETGALYHHAASRSFMAPQPGRDLSDQGLIPHFGSPGGVLPQVL